MSSDDKKLEQLSINTIRILAAEGVQKANSGHPGMPMGCAPIAYMLYTKLMKHNPKNPKWLNRDRFILSGGHGSMLLYSILHLSGYNLSLEQIKQFRQWGSLTPGHPEFGLTEGVETTTGPLGQGFANAVGMAIAQEYLAAMFNKDEIKILDHYIYGTCGDGDMMEGISHEAASLAGHLKLKKIIFFYDDNGITIDGQTNLAFSDDVEKRFNSYGWNVLRVNDVNDTVQIEIAVLKAKKSDKPTLIITKTHIGYGSPNKQDTSEIHGSPLGDEEIKLTKKNLGWGFEENFFIPGEVKDYFNSLIPEFDLNEKEWNKTFEDYKKGYPEEAERFIKYMNGEIGTEWIEKLPVFEDDGKKVATRQQSGKTISAIASALPIFIGGSADLAPSNNTYVKGFSAFSSDNYSGRNFHFGIREHAMAAIMNGVCMYGGIIIYGGTFLVFSDYLRPAIRIAAMSHIRPIYVFTHDSIGLGEDGPSHQPVEHLASLRAIPGHTVIRPADGNETAQAWKYAILHKSGPVSLILSRQGMLTLNQKKYGSAENLKYGAYILKEGSRRPDVILIATGSEVGLVLSAQELLEKEGIATRVVSFPSWELFEQQNDEYKESVFPKEIKARVSVEAGVSLGWQKYTGDSGKVIGLDRYGASAPEKTLFEKFGFTVENIVRSAKDCLGKA